MPHRSGGGDKQAQTNRRVRGSRSVIKITLYANCRPSARRARFCTLIMLTKVRVENVRGEGTEGNGRNERSYPINVTLFAED